MAIRKTEHRVAPSPSPEPPSSALQVAALPEPKPPDPPPPEPPNSDPLATTTGLLLTDSSWSRIKAESSLWEQPWSGNEAAGVGRRKERAAGMKIRELKFGSSTSKEYRFMRGIPIYAISQVLDKIISGATGPPLLINGVKRPMPLVRILEVELYPTLLSKARSFGLSDDWIQALVKKDPIRRQVLRVKGCLAGSKAENLLMQGDMVLAINKEPVTCFHDIENACLALDKSYGSDGKLQMTIFRQGREVELLVGTDVRDGNGTTRAINWCGSIVQDPHPAVRALGFLPEEGHGVYVARCCHGSPVDRYGLYALQWIVEIDGKPTPDLDSFVDVTKELAHGEFVRVRTIHLNGKPRVLTLKQDLHYWPTWELRFNPDTGIWHRNVIKALNCSSDE